MRNPEGFFTYDHLLEQPLAGRGWIVSHIPWDEPQAAWSEFQAVVIRSPWDYQENAQKFLTTLEEIESQTLLFNSTRICRWNMDKAYLVELQERGLPVIPTQLVSALDDKTIEAQLSDMKTRFQSETIVVKPTVGANSDNVFCLDQELDSWQEALRVFASRPCLIQPFLPSILSTGEISLFYFGTRYSHAIRKRPKQGDFRVQEEHGGTIESIRADQAMLDVGSRVIDSLSENLLYARVDLATLDDQQFALMELELIEPSLYFPYDPKSPDRFCDAFDELMAAN